MAWQAARGRGRRPVPLCRARAEWRDTAQAAAAAVPELAAGVGAVLGVGCGPASLRLPVLSARHHVKEGATVSRGLASDRHMQWKDWLIHSTIAACIQRVADRSGRVKERGVSELTHKVAAKVGEDAPETRERNARVYCCETSQRAKERLTSRRGRGWTDCAVGSTLWTGLSTCCRKGAWWETSTFETE